MPLTANQLDRLYEAMNTAFFGDDTALNRIVRFTFDRTTLHSIMTATGEKDSLFAVIDWFDKHGKLSTLFDRIDRERPDHGEVHDAVQQLRLEVSCVSEAAIGFSTERDHVAEQHVKLVAGIGRCLGSDAHRPTIAVSALHTRATPHGWTSELPFGPKTPMECARDLSRANPNLRTGYVPLLAFVQGLVQHVTGDQAAQLRHWLREAIRSYTTTHELSEQLIRSALAE